MRIAFDIDGVISKYPDEFNSIILSLMHNIGFMQTCMQPRKPHEIYVITDMHEKDGVLKQLKDNGFGLIPPENVYCANYDKYGELCKAVLLRDLKIDMFFDDFIGYLAWPSEFGPAPIRLLVMPDGYRPYWHEEWKCDGGEFGRRVYNRPAQSD